MSDETAEQSENDLSIEFPFDEIAEKALASRSRFDKIFISGKQIITVKAARAFRSFPSVEFLQVWCGITRAAVRDAMRCPDLNSLVIFELKPGGRLDKFEKVRGLEYFCCMYGLNSNDFREISKLPHLRKLGAQQSKITADGLNALIDAANLVDLDFECSNFNDEHATLLSKSVKIKTLEIGATRISRIGLEAICSMQQLRELDIWANNIDEDDIDALAALQNLEYLSVGGHDDQTDFTPDGTFPKLEKIPSLKRVWLDGFRVTKAEWDYLNKRYEAVRVTSVGE